MVAAQPLEACTPLQNDATAVQGAIVLVQRGEGGRERASSALVCLEWFQPVPCRFTVPAAHAAAYVQALLCSNPPAGTCAFSQKAQAAQDAGAAGVLIYDNVLQAYFTWGGDDAVGACRAGSGAGCFMCRAAQQLPLSLGTEGLQACIACCSSHQHPTHPPAAASITIPVMSVTRRIGLSLVASGERWLVDASQNSTPALCGRQHVMATPVAAPSLTRACTAATLPLSAASVGKAVTLSFSTSRAPENSFENLASYSSQGAAWRGKRSPCSCCRALGPRLLATVQLVLARCLAAYPVYPASSAMLIMSPGIHSQAPPPTSV